MKRFRRESYLTYELWDSGDQILVVRIRHQPEYHKHPWCVLDDDWDILSTHATKRLAVEAARKIVADTKDAAVKGVAS